MVFLIMMGGPMTSATESVRRDLRPFEDGGHKADLAGPVRCFAAGIDAADHAHALTLRPLLQLVNVNQVGDGARAVDDRDVAVVSAVLQGVPDGAADGRHGDSAAEEDEILPLPRFHRISVSVRAAKADGVAFLDFP